jgi:capsular polysaccharide transport system permease protein
MFKTRSSLQIQIDVIKALFGREMKTYFGVRKMGYAWVILEPLINILPFYLIRLAVGASYEINLFLFLITGFLPFFIISHSVNKAAGVINSNASLFSYKHVKPIDAIITRVLIELLIFSIAFPIFFGGTIFFTEEIFFVKNPIELLVVVFLIFLLSCAAAIYVAVFICLYPSLNKIPGMIMRVLYFTSALFFSLSELPPSLQGYMLYNPLLHLIELFRYNIFAEIHSTPANYYYPTLFTISFLFMSLLYYKKHRYNLIIQK